TYAVLDTPRVPRQVVVHDDVSELEVDTLASGVSGNENACFGTEVFLGDAAFLQVHGAVDRDRLNPGAFQQIEQHVLSGHELGEDDDLERRVGFLTLQAPDQVQQVPDLGVRPFGDRSFGQVDEDLHLGPLIPPGGTLGPFEGGDLLFAREVPPSFGALRKEAELIFEDE